MEVKAINPPRNYFALLCAQCGLSLSAEAASKREENLPKPISNSKLKNLKLRT
jgi:hypothetical protein